MRAGRVERQLTKDHHQEDCCWAAETFLFVVKHCSDRHSVQTWKVWGISFKLWSFTHLVALFNRLKEEYVRISWVGHINSIFISHTWWELVVWKNWQNNKGTINSVSGESGEWDTLTDVNKGWQSGCALLWVVSSGIFVGVGDIHKLSFFSKSINRFLNALVWWRHNNGNLDDQMVIMWRTYFSSATITTKHVLNILRQPRLCGFHLSCG